MGPVYLLELASSQARWLALRQVTVSTNVANANTPGYIARDVERFDKILDSTAGTSLVVTSPRHISIDPLEARTHRARKTDSWDVVHSGNSVSVEQEMLKAGDINRDYSLNAAIVKSFHRMFSASMKG